MNNDKKLTQSIVQRFPVVFPRIIFQFGSILFIFEPRVAQTTSLTCTMDRIKLLLVLVLALGAERTYSQQPSTSNFRLLTGSESRELKLGQNPELQDFLARTGERVIINVTEDHSTAILQEGVNALIDCLPFLRRFPGRQISWFSRRTSRAELSV